MRDLSQQEPTRRYPAGRAVAVVVLALLFAALLDADSLVAAVSSEPYGASRTLELALVRPFRAVSDTFGLNLPHRWLADIAGTNQPNPGTHLPPTDTTPSAISSVLLPAPLAHPSEGDGLGQPARTPTASAPLRVWLAGDSMMGEIADAFMEHVAGDPAVVASEDVQIGTGLARPDVYNWPVEVALEMRTAHPGVVVLTFGANDNQPMVAGGRALALGSSGWTAEYRKRVAEVMDEVTGAGGVVVWVEDPPVAPSGLDRVDQLINEVVREEAAGRSGVAVVDPVPVVAPQGRFTEYLGGLQVRAADGVHLTPAGAARLLPAILQAIRSWWQLR